MACSADSTSDIVRPYLRKCQVTFVWLHPGRLTWNGPQLPLRPSQARVELVAQRIVRLAKLVGREHVLASTDCGFAQGPFHRRVHPTVMWAKLEALAAGARLASAELWH